MIIVLDWHEAQVRLRATEHLAAKPLGFGELARLAGQKHLAATPAAVAAPAGDDHDSDGPDQASETGNPDHARSDYAHLSSVPTPVRRRCARPARAGRAMTGQRSRAISVVLGCVTEQVQDQPGGP